MRMTRNEAKTIDECLKELKEHRNVYLKRSTPWRVVNRALYLIEELKQYRTIGTIEEVKSMVHIGEWAYTKGYNKAIDECLKMIEETVWRDTDMLVENIRQLKEGAE